jgi:arylsulfatase A-like enzyme
MSVLSPPPPPPPPFFIYLAYNAPHGPHAGSTDKSMSTFKNIKRWQLPPGAADASLYEWKNYAGCITNMDDNVGR